MKEVTIADQHPGKYHDGQKLILCEYKTDDGDSGITGVRRDSSKEFGMFNSERECIQDIGFRNDEWIFTMFNITDVNRTHIDKLLEDGTVVIERYFKGDNKEQCEPYYSLELKVIE